MNNVVSGKRSGPCYSYREFRILVVISRQFYKMLKMKKILGTSILIVLISLAGYSQSTYRHAIGGRIGSGYYDIFSASYKTFLGDSPGALEFNFGFRPYSGAYNWVNLSFSASYQYHFDIEAVEGLKWFIGGGLTAFNSFSSNSSYSGFGLGFFPTGGADYKFSEIPLNISLDFRPTIQIIKPYDYYDNFYFANFGLAARYTF
jgi:hypothetical protein